jgi:hypothetical protein
MLSGAARSAVPATEGWNVQPAVSRSSSSDEKGVSQESQELQSWEDVKQPVYDLGSTAAMRLVHRPHNPGVLTRQEIVLAPTLCIRGSSRSRVHALPA